MRSQPEQYATGEHRSLFLIIEHILRAGLHPLARLLTHIVSFKESDEPVEVESDPPPNPSIPTGPVVRARTRQRGRLLLFVPRSLRSRIIDEVTGSYGYSHLAIDCGEKDLLTGKRVMIESIPGALVRHVFLDRYGARPFASIPVGRTGVDVDEFCECAHSHLDERYDYLEALTWGMVDDPARQMCSDLAAACLPARVHEKIARQQKEGNLPPRSISRQRIARGDRDLFISPNAFAVYYQIPHGYDLNGPNQTVIPRPLGEPEKFLPDWAKKAVAAGAIASALLGVLVIAAAFTRRKPAAPENQTAGAEEAPAEGQAKSEAANWPQTGQTAR